VNSPHPLALRTSSSTLSSNKPLESTPCWMVEPEKKLKETGSGTWCWLVPLDRWEPAQPVPVSASSFAFSTQRQLLTGTQVEPPRGTTLSFWRFRVPDRSVAFGRFYGGINPDGLSPTVRTNESVPVGAVGIPGNDSFSSPDGLYPTIKPARSQHTRPL